MTNNKWNWGVPEKSPKDDLVSCQQYTAKFWQAMNSSREHGFSEKEIIWWQLHLYHQNLKNIKALYEFLGINE